MTRRKGGDLAGDLPGRASIPQGKPTFERNVAVLAGATVLGQGLAVIAAPLLTRLYSPLDFGVLAAFAAVVGVLTVVASGCYDQAVNVPEDDVGAANVLVLSLVLLAITSLACAVAVHYSQDALATALGLGQLRHCLWLIPAGLVAAGLHQVFLAWAVRRRAFKAVARAKIGRNFSQVAAQIGLGFWLPGPLGLVLGDLAGRVAGALALAGHAWREDHAVLGTVRPRETAQLAHRYRHFPFPTGGSLLFHAAVMQVPTFVLMTFYGPAVLGLYALGQRVIAMPLFMLGEAVGQVFQSEFARVPRNDHAGLRRLFLATMGKLLAVGGPPIIVLGLLGPALFGPLFGERWANAGVYLQLMAPVLLIQFVANPLGFTLTVLERHDLIVWREVIFVACMAVAVFGVWHGAVTAYTAIALLCAANVVAYLAYAWICWLAIAGVQPKPAAHATAAI